jgi:glycosyltransferase involved in cell wall biosynthesis
MVVIPNGVDLDVFRPDSDARLALRHELHLTEDAILIGIVARFHPQKDHATFVQAAGKLHRMCPQVQFVLCGDGMVWENRTLVDWLEAAGVSHCCHLLGERDDIPYLNAALDIATLSSAFGETFGIVIAEAMACEVPCVVTDLAVAAQIVGDTGRVVPIKNPQAMAVAWQELIALGRDALQQLGQRARQRILEHYSLPATIAGYESLYKDLAGYIGP